MAEKRISELTAKGGNLQSTDLLEVSVDAGGGSYVTRYVTGAQITGAVSSANFANTNLTFTSPRSHDINGYTLTLSGGNITFSVPLIDFTSSNGVKMNYMRSNVWNDINDTLNLIRYNVGGDGYIRLERNLLFTNIPTSSAGLPSGAVWSDSGTLKLV